jgi:hypothetical protein
MKPLPDTGNGGYVTPPPEVVEAVQVGFFSLWLTRNTVEFHGVEGKMLYVHHHSLWVARWLFGWESFLDEKKWKTVDKFKQEADKAFAAKVNQYLGELK